MEDRSFYVYAHYRLDTMEPFYIGKGREGRANKLNRNSLHDNISKKHGHAVVILYDNLTEEEAFFYERETIEDLVFNEGYEIHCKNCGEFTGTFSYLTNFSFGGEGISGHNHNEETKKKMSIANKKYYEDPKKREKMSVIIKKHYEDPKEREKCGLPGEKNGMYGKGYKITGYKNGMYGKGYKLSGEKNGKAKSVYCNELNILFTCVKIAEKYCINVLNSKIGPIRDVCNGKRNFTGKLTDGTKLTWNWLEDIDQETLKNAIYIDDEKYNELISKNVNDCK